MRKPILLLLAICFFAAGSASARHFDQSVTETATGVVNVATTSAKIMKVLTPSLGLTKMQQPTVLKLVSTYLLARNNLNPLKSSNSSGYSSKFGILSNGKPSATNTAAVQWILFS
ncbi:hypothetical protein WJU16_05055 [Chitinophaga pollutisoli]|uniref:Uncharacterized protein n=1 Tax=Chitinophaga pollutisoli TaxID=3133966 RepID=A0ABZ2YS87_9BACT